MNTIKVSLIYQINGIEVISNIWVTQCTYRQIVESKKNELMNKYDLTHSEIVEKVNL
jgi:hypothetical protein